MRKGTNSATGTSSIRFGTVTANILHVSRPQVKRHAELMPKAASTGIESICIDFLISKVNLDFVTVTIRTPTERHRPFMENFSTCVPAHAYRSRKRSSQEMNAGALQ